jgi:hypothetical protein
MGSEEALILRVAAGSCKSPNLILGFLQPGVITTGIEASFHFSEMPGERPYPKNAAPAPAHAATMIQGGMRQNWSAAKAAKASANRFGSVIVVDQMGE